MHFDYEILAIRAVDDPETKLFPKVIDKGKQIELTPIDGKVQATHALVSAASYLPKDGKSHLLRNAPTNDHHRHTLSLTQARLIVSNHDFKSADRWDIAAGMPGFYAAGLVLSHAQIRNRALVAGLWYYCIDQIMVHGSGGITEENQIIVQVKWAAPGKSLQPIRLRVTLPLRTDPRPLAQHLLQLTCDFWLRHRPGNFPSYDAFGEMRSSPMLTPARKEWATYQLPRCLPVTAKY